MRDYFKRMQDKQHDDMMHYYHNKKIQDEKKRNEEEAEKYGTIPRTGSSLGRRIAKGLGVIILIGVIIVLLRFLFNAM